MCLTMVKILLQSGPLWQSDDCAAWTSKRLPSAARAKSCYGWAKIRKQLHMLKFPFQGAIFRIATKRLKVTLIQRPLAYSVHCIDCSKSTGVYR
jgi:hypothetical protein